MIVDLPEWIREVLSIPRFAPYLARTNGDLDAAIRLYKWNVEISAAFYTPLHCLELGLRNAMHERLRTRFDRADWWVVAPLSDNGERTVSSAVEKVVGRSGRLYTADDIVAELSFGLLGVIGQSRRRLRPDAVGTSAAPGVSVLPGQAQAAA